MSGEEMAVSRQEKANRDYCAAKGWVVVRVYRENDTSASGRKPRPKFAQMLVDARNGEFDVIVATFLDRLTRSVRDLLPLIELYRQHKVATATVRDSLDLTSDVGELVATILAAVAQLEIKRKGERQTLANGQRAENGLPSIGGKAILGYREDKLTVDPMTAPAVAKAFQDALAGVSLSSIARSLSAGGYVTHKGNGWTHQAVRTMLRNPRYAGIRVYRGQEMGTAAWEAIVDEPTLRAVRALLSDPGRRTNPHPGGTRRWLGTGLYRCGVCAAAGIEETMVSSYRAGGVRSYQCRSSKHLVRVAASIDDYVIDTVLRRLSRKDALDLLVDHDRPDLRKLAAEAARLRVELDELAADTELTLSQVRVRSRKRRDRLAEVEAAMEHTDRSKALAGIVGAKDVEKVWASFAEDIDRQKAIVAAATRSVTLLKNRPGGNTKGGPQPLRIETVEIDLR